MSFDLYFVDRPSDGDWNRAFDEHDSFGEPGETVDREKWNKLHAAVSVEFPDPELFEADDSCELSHPDTGIQLMMFPSEIALTCPYWHEGEAADEVDAKLRRIATAIEQITGLGCYDPQSGGPFLESTTAGAPEMNRMRGLMRKAGILRN